MTLTPFRLRPHVRLRPVPAPGRRMRRVGRWILATGLVVAALVYWLETRRGEPTMDELLPGYSRANSRLMGIYYGPAGKMMWEWREAIARPEVQAILIILTAAIAAAVCFRVAWLDEDRASEP